jgi:hypothetical protein
LAVITRRARSSDADLRRMTNGLLGVPLDAVTVE